MKLNLQELAKLRWIVVELGKMHSNYGRCACPGRAFANHTFGTIATCALTNYALRLMEESEKSRNSGDRCQRNADLDVRLVMPSRRQEGGKANKQDERAESWNR